MLLSCGSRMRAKTLHTICRRNAVKWLASETTHRHDPAFRCPLSYSRASIPSSTPMCKPTNTPMRSMSGKRLIMVTSSVRLPYHVHRSLATGVARMVAVPDRPSSRSQ
jgi:hypothetical protein